MTKFFTVGLLYVLFAFSSQAQRLYSLQNLQQSSPENLSTYLTFAKKQKRTGAFLIKTGLITAGAGIVVAVASYDSNEWIGINAGTIIGSWMTILGTGATIVGLPILITGSSRVKRINNIIFQNSGSVNIELTPYRFQCSIVPKNLYGATLRIRF